MYTKLVTIKYNNKIFDVFVGEDHKKVFLEIIDNKYCYPKLNDFIYLNSVYNHSNKDVYYSNKYKFVPKVLVATGALICAISVYDIDFEDLKLAPNNFKNAILMSSSIEIDSVKEFDKYDIPSVDFEDVRKTLEENKNIPDKYRKYIEKYIDALEQRLPLIDLRIFNENLSKLSFAIVSAEELAEEKRDGYTNFKVDKVTIGLKNEYVNSAGEEDLEREIFVVFHELTHVLRHGYIISPRNEVIEFNFISDYNYGRQIYESMTDLFSEYLLCEDYENYFGPEYREPDSYIKAEYVYQMLKLFGEKYSFYDYFNYDIYKFYDLLNEYGLSEIIDSYDVYTSSVDNDIVIDDSLIKKSENKLMTLRYQQLMDQGHDYEYMNDVLWHFGDVLGVDFYKQLFIDNFIYAEAGEAALITVGNSIDKDKKYTFSNPVYMISYNGEVIYNKRTFEKNGEEIICNNLYITVIDNGELQRRMVMIEDNKLIDLITQETYDLDCELIHLSDIFETVNYNYEINLNTFLDSDLVKFKTEWMTEKLGKKK